MKGAMTDPWLKTSTTPSSAMTSSTGSNHCFLRDRRKAQSSVKNVNGPSSIHAREVIGRGPTGLPRDPVAARTRIAPQPQRVLAGHPGDQPDGGHHAIEDGAHQQRRRDPMQQQAEAKP